MDERPADAPPRDDHPCAPCAVRFDGFCKALTDDDLAKLRCEGSTLRLDPGEALFHEGDASGEVYNLTAGSLKLYTLLPDGRRQVTGFVYPGDFLGVSIDADHAFTAEAMEHAEMCRYSRARFDAFAAAHPRMQRALYRMAAHELAAAREQMVLLGRKTALERLASFLLAAEARQHRRPRAGALVHLPMTRVDLADHLGLTKETVSRVFTRLRTEQVIRLPSDNLVRIVDHQRLERIAGCEPQPAELRLRA